MSSALGRALKDSKVIIAVGAGGVGKTTIAASLALRSALDGKSALVCTIDPAKRLANALGLTQLGNAETTISAAAFESAGLTPKAPLTAMMLDMKRSWDELVARYAPADRREQILQNRFYQSLSTALAGSQEYIAIEKLCELRHSNRHELVVLDTPPTVHALDFLDAPNRILDFLENDAAKWLLTPALAAGKLGFSLLNFGGSYVAKTLSRFTGGETLQQLAGFMLALSGMNESFRERAHQTRELLAAPTTSFVLVTGAMPERVDECLAFFTLLRQSHLNVAAVVVNRVHVAVSESAWHAAAQLDDGLRKPVEKTLEENDILADQDARGVARLRELCGHVPLILVPRFARDVHDLGALSETSRYLLQEVG